MTACSKWLCGPSCLRVFVVQKMLSEAKTITQPKEYIEYRYFFLVLIKICPSVNFGSYSTFPSTKKAIMNQKTYSQFVLALGISLALIACNDSSTKSTEAQSTDTAITSQTEAPPSSTPADALDPVKVAPDRYKVLTDSLGIRIVEVNYAPGDSSALHAHPDNVLYVVRGGTASFTGQDGAKWTSELKTGLTAVRPPEAHSAKNTGKAPFRAILVEVRRPMNAAPRAEATDAVKVAPSLYAVKNDSAGIRVLEINYKPGQSSAMHAHPDGAIYVLEGSTSEFTDKDGNKQTMTLKAGTAMIMAAGEHSVKNVGTTNTKAILVEVYRQRQ